MLNILYVEDDSGSRSVMRMVERMNPSSFNITIFEDSHNFEANLLTLDFELNLIFLDIHVKPYTGFEMLEMIRVHTQYDNVPVVALTASVMNDEVEILKQAGFRGVIGKPIDLDDFPNLIQMIMDGKTVWRI